MLLILSPAKIQNFDVQNRTEKHTVPLFLDEANYIIEDLRSLPKKQIAELLKTNNEITTTTYDQYYNWSKNHNTKNSKQALFVYAGEVYRGLHAGGFTQSEIDFAQSHLRLLSGLYGVLRPLDLIQPYRFEMSAKLANNKGKDMYAFWAEKVTSAINKAIEESGEPQVLLNLCSNEYFKALNKKELNAPVIHFDFLENRNDTYKPVTIYVKKARGLMTRYVIENRIDKVEDLKAFDLEGYWFNSALSTGNKLVFTRE